MCGGVCTHNACIHVSWGGLVGVRLFPLLCMGRWVRVFIHVCSCSNTKFCRYRRANIMCVGMQPDAHSQCLSIQFTWNGVRKPVSSTFVGVSPEFEVALYTLCFYGEQEDNYMELGPYNVNIKCYHLGRDKLGSSFPIVQD